MARSYLVGLPVVITVEDDGSVTYEVDKSEAGAAIRELPSYMTEIEADADRVAAAAVEDRYYWQPLDETNVTDAVDALCSQQMVGIVDEREAGIVAYASEETARRIVGALRECW